MTFFTELKRRNVIRVGILYLISAWLLLQLTNVLSSLLSAPEWTGSVMVVLLAIGFFPTLAFSWVFELTSEGLKRESEIDHSELRSDADSLEHFCRVLAASGCAAHPAAIPYAKQQGLTDLWDQRGPPDRCSKIGGEWTCE
jgi:hypothetical protein